MADDRTHSRERGQLWEGRFATGPAEAARLLGDSLGFDRRLFREDIEVSRAHVSMLEATGLLSHDDVARIHDALAAIEAEIASGTFNFEESDEDIHTAVERRLTEIVGEPGAKLQTARSRNDQVAADLRLWVVRQIHEIVGLIARLQHALLRQAESAGEAYLPGYTHLQQAQPISLAHHLLAHGWALQRDVERLTDALRRANVSPLGAGALAGTSLPIDPEITAELLGFDAVFDNSLDAVSDRDFVAETLFAIAMTAIHLSRMGEELVIWSSSEFRFVEIADSYTTGSSMMPQKKNPDLAELVRGKSGRIVGDLVGFLTTLKGLPLSYNKDLQEDKEALFDAVDTIKLSLQGFEGMLASCRFDHSRMATLADSPYGGATDLAEWLVGSGMPFREAHAMVAGLVRESLDSDSDFVALVKEHPRLGEEAAGLLAPGSPVKRRTSPGGASPVSVEAQMRRFRSIVGGGEARAP